MLAKRFAKFLKANRERLKLSQEAFGEKAGLHRTYISQLERGLKVPSLVTLELVAKACGMTLASFIRMLESTD